MNRWLIFVLVLCLNAQVICVDDNEDNSSTLEDDFETFPPDSEDHISTEPSSGNEQDGSDATDGTDQTDDNTQSAGEDSHENEITSESQDESIESTELDFDQDHTDIMIIKNKPAPKGNEMPPLIGKYYNTTYITYETQGNQYKTRTDYSRKKINSTHEAYNVKSFSLLPGKKADGVMSRVGKVVGVIPVLNRGFGVKCWDDIGCFSAIDVSDGVNVVGMLPMDPQQIDTKFYLFTYESRNTPIVLNYTFDVQTVLESTFNYTHQTVIIVHGFKSGLSDWMTAIKDMLYQLPRNLYNVVLVDWSKGADILSYGLAAANTQVVGALIAFFIDRLCETVYERKVTNDMFYLIGHSLGAHTMGFAGKRLVRPRVGRITALDPAGPIFENYPPDARLYYTDAQFVDAIHTDMAQMAIVGLGLDDPVGDIDFFPNGGKLQPGCPQSIMIQNALSYPQEVSCSHSRSHELTAAFGNVNDYCLPVGYMCDDWELFLEGRCANCDTLDDIANCQLMGFYPTYFKNFTLENKRGVGQKYYLNTARDNGFCLYHYQLAFHMTRDSDSKSNGEIELELSSKINKKPAKIRFKRTISQIFAGKVHTILVTFRFMVKNIKQIEVRWTQKKTKAKRGKKLKIKYIEVNYLSHIVAKIRQQLSVLLCPSADDFITPNSTKALFERCDREKLEISALNYMIDLKPLTEAKDIISVSYDNEDRIDNKIKQVKAEELKENALRYFINSKLLKLL